MRAQRIQERAAKPGFDWDRIDGPLDKVEEEFAELRQACQQGDAAAVEDEFGDLLFAMVNTSRFLNVDSEQALRAAVVKFERRFRALEAKVAASGRELSDLSLTALDAIWDEVKEGE